MTSSQDDKAMNVGDPVYRYVSSRRGCYGDDEGYEYGSVYIRLETYYVFKLTKCGFWLTWDWQKDNPKPIWKRFVNHGSTKKFAHATKEDAQKSFMKRKQVQIFILTRQLQDAKESLELAKKGQFES